MENTPTKEHLISLVESMCDVQGRMLALNECRSSHYMYALADYANPLHTGYVPLTGVEGRGLPFPPLGTSPTNTVY